MRRKIQPRIGLAALKECLDNWDNTLAKERYTAVRYTLEELSLRAPGNSVEVRIPPAGAVQIIQGSTHRRGMPPATVQTDMLTWLHLCCGLEDWACAKERGALVFSGQGSDLSALLPIFNLQ